MWDSNIDRFMKICSLKIKECDIAKRWLLDECKMTMRLFRYGCKMIVRIIWDDYIMTDLLNIKDCDIIKDNFEASLR